VADPKIKVTADTSQAQRELAGLEKSMQSLNDSALLATKALAGITAAGAALAFAVKKGLDSVDELAKTSRQLGMTAADLQAFRNSASLAGVGSDELTNSLRRLQVNIGNALVKGTGPAKDALDRLGISMKELQGLNAQEQFQKIAEQVAKIPDPAIRASTATELLGKQGPKLLEAADSFERMRREAEQLGIALSTTDTVAIERANDAMSELSMIADGFIQKLAAELAPVLIIIAERIKATVIEMGGLDTIIRQRVIPAIKIATQAMVALVTYIVAAKVVASIMGMVAAMVKFYQAIKVAVIATRTLNAAVAATPIGRITRLGSALLRAGKNVLGMGVAIGAATVAVNALDDGFDSLDDLVSDILKEIEMTADSIDDAANNASVLADNTVKVESAANKALEAYQGTVARLKENVNLQQDILKYGEEEAKIRQVIRQEQEKYAGANAATIRSLIEQENALKKQREDQAKILKDQEETLKRQLTLQREQDRVLRDSLQSTSTFAKEMEKLERLNMQFVDGMTSEEIDRAMERRARAANDMIEAQTGVNAAIVNQRNAVKAVVDAEIAKYDRMKALDQQMLRDKEAIDQILRYNAIGAIKLEEDQVKGLTAAKLEIERRYHADKQQLIQETLQRQIDAERKSREEALKTQGIVVGGYKLRSVSEEEAKKIVADRAAFEKKTDLEKTKFALDNMQSLFAALGAQNRKAFEANKALAVASALVNTYQGATKALATYPFPFNLIAAAGAVAAGMAQVSAIRSQQYSGRSLGGPVMGGTPYIVGENGPELFTPSTTGSITRNSDLQSGKAVNVNFTIIANDTQGFDELLTSRKGVITQIISDAMLERGTRSMI